MDEKQTSNVNARNFQGKKKLNPAHNSRPKPNSGTHSFNKRPTGKPFQRVNDIYVSNKANFKVQMKQCQELLMSDEVDEIYLHCLGNAINRGITLALTLVQESNNGLGYEANTSTIDLIDDFHPLNDEEDFTIQKRRNSCLHIKIFRQLKLLLLNPSE